MSASPQPKGTNTSTQAQGATSTMYQNFAGKGDLYWHVHHEILAEALTEPLQNRIDYIERSKPKDQIAWRLHSIRRVNDDPDWPTTLRALREFGASNITEFKQTNGGLAVADLEALHAKQCFPNCPWDGTNLLTNAEGASANGF